MHSKIIGLGDENDFNVLDDVKRPVQTRMWNIINIKFVYMRYISMRKITGEEKKEWSQSDPRVIQKWSQSGPRVVPETSVSPELSGMSPICPQDVPKMSPRWTEWKLKNWQDHWKELLLELNKIIQFFRLSWTAFVHMTNIFINRRPSSIFSRIINHWALVILTNFLARLAISLSSGMLNLTIAGSAIFFRKPRVNSFKNVPMTEICSSFLEACLSFALSFLGTVLLGWTIVLAFTFPATKSLLDPTLQCNPIHSNA